jgi:hypothetical protein
MAVIVRLDRRPSRAYLSANRPPRPTAASEDDAVEKAAAFFLRLRILFVLTLLLASCAPTADTQASATPTVALPVVTAEVATDPDAPAGRYRVDFVVSDARDVYGAEFHATIDPALVQTLDSDEQADGLQLAPGAAFGPDAAYVAVNRIDMASGKIDFAATLLGQVEPLQGRLVLASWSIEVSAAARLSVAFGRVVLADPHANKLEVTIRDAALDLTP